MHPLDAAILRTLLYADIFSYPMTTAELHFFLIHDEAISQQTLIQHLHNSALLQQRICQDGEYIVLQGKEDAINRRRQRETITQTLMPLAEHYGVWLAQIPFVRMVALTGALAVRNPSHARDDFDYMLVIQPGRVWLARLCAIVLVRIARLRGIELCPNYVLASDQLLQDRQDLFIAHEVTQMIPLYGEAIYQQFHHENSWTALYLANVHPRRMPTRAIRSGWAKKAAEWLLKGRLGDWLENWEYRHKSAKFARKMHSPETAAIIDSNNVKGHFEDHGWPVLREYEARLRAYGLDEASQRSA